MKLVLGLAFVLSICCPAFGQVPNSEEPGIFAKRFEQPATPRATSAGTIRLPEAALPAALANVSVHLVKVAIRGSTIYDDARLKQLYGQYLYQTVALATVYRIAQSITKLYGDDGYLLTRAVVTPQEIDPKHPTVAIEVSEAYVDQVKWPTSISRYRDVFSGYTQKIVSERPSNIRTVMRYLLLPMTCRAST